MYCAALITSLLALASGVVATQTPEIVPRQASVASPSLTFLYTLNCTLDPAIVVGNGPKGLRRVIPITGGWFSGPKMKGEVLNLGADWALTDDRNVSHPDTRYALRTDDGADIYIRTFGSRNRAGVSYLHGEFETGSDKYWWLNDVVSVGVLQSGGGKWVNIDMFIMENDGLPI